MLSVCLASYNGEKYLQEQVNSILLQLTSEDELIISDDGSTDQTIEILKSYNDSRIKIYSNHRSSGVNNNFQNALEHAKGDIIFLADQDDVWLPDKVKTCCEALRTCDCVVHDAIVVDGELQEISPSFFSDRHSGNGFIKNIYKNSYLGCCMAFRQEILDSCLPIPNTTAFFHDNWIGCIADLKYNLQFIPFKGILFRRHSDNTSCTAKKSNFSFTKKLNNRISQIIKVIDRLYFKRNHFGT